ncbi:coq1 putative hexaprenyl diphosphate synthase [Marasmius crinis-equi]|uniref:(2E,6E)-farnesyl diphosphate synthase n=1 Tax=Marasmius crinis-equi TaxID=585013 RepID=A0ABR3FNR7_9AGAR
MRIWTTSSRSLGRQLLSRRALNTDSHRPDPFSVVGPQLAHVRDNLVRLLGSAHPNLHDIAKYYFLKPSKQLRPLIVLLFSQATNGLGKEWPKKLWESETHGVGRSSDELDKPLSRPDVLNDWNPHISKYTTPFDTVFHLHNPHPYIPPPQYSEGMSSGLDRTLTSPPRILPTQIRLAQIVEMIHAASLLHDDVIDESPLRRGSPSAPVSFGNKLAILGGNFILGRASAALARLGDPEAIELIASIIANLVEGEILQMQEVHAEDLHIPPTPEIVRDAWTIYLQKTYMKTASLMAKGARAAICLGGCSEGEIYREVAYTYGRNLGIAFQLVDDVLDYDAMENNTLGKPGGADLQLGLATGPALYAWEEHPEMGPLIRRKFGNAGDVELARNLVRKSSGVERTRQLAIEYADQAKKVLQPLPDSEAKAALEALTDRVIKRKS